MRFLVALIVTCLLNIGSSHAQIPDMRSALRQSIAIVDVDNLIRSSKAGKSVQSQMTSLQESFKKEISSEENALRSAEQELSRQRDVLDAAAYASKRKEFEQKVIAVQRRVQDKKRRLDMAFGKAMQQIQDHLVKVLAAIAERKQLMMVLRRTQVLLAENALDITKDVLADLDKDLTYVKVELPPAGGR